MNFQRLWDMTPEEVLKAYQVKKEDTNLYEEQGRNAAFVLENQEVFGKMRLRRSCLFYGYGVGEGEDIQILDEGKEGGEKLLYGVTVIYPQDADMIKLGKYGGAVWEKISV